MKKILMCASLLSMMGESASSVTFKNDTLDEVAFSSKLPRLDPIHEKVGSEKTTSFDLSPYLENRQKMAKKTKQDVPFNIDVRTTSMPMLVGTCTMTVTADDDLEKLNEMTLTVTHGGTGKKLTCSLGTLTKK